MIEFYFEFLIIFFVTLNFLYIKVFVLSFYYQLNDNILFYKLIFLTCITLSYDYD